MLIAVGSENPAKIEAVREAFSKIFPKTNLQITGITVSSGISDQPMSDEEAIKGATTRAKKAIKKLNADYGVGLEGGLHKIGNEWYESGWIVIIDKINKRSIGSAIRMPVPKKLMILINKGIEMGVACDIIFKTENVKHKEGFFGLMTNKGVTRTSAYRDGVIAALSRFLHPELFNK